MQKRRTDSLCKSMESTTAAYFTAIEHMFQAETKRRKKTPNWSRGSVLRFVI